jgi:hypothetical protein
MVSPVVLTCVLIVMLLLGPVMSRTAQACVCPAIPACAAVWRADAVFVGTVVDRTSEPLGGKLSWTVNKVIVNQVLLGSADWFITLVPTSRPTAEEIAQSERHAQPLTFSSSCEYDFRPGSQYLIYARRGADGRLATAMCSGTKPIEQAAGDLDYIAGIPLAEPTGRVYGTIDRTQLSAANRTVRETVPAAGVRVALTSATKRLTVTTDAEGKLDVQVPPGDYTVAPVVPGTVRVYGAPQGVSVPARGCAPVYFSLTSNGRIEGRVTEQDGTPVSGASVDVIPADVPLDHRFAAFRSAPSGSTDETGRFAVDAILPGRYVLAVNARLGPRLVSPYATTFFPSGGRQEAREIDLGDGERKSALNIVVTPLAETTISGVVLFDDERPAADAFVTVTPNDHEGMSIGATTTDRGGAFEVRVLAGITYLIKARVGTQEGNRQTETVVFVEEEQKQGLRLVIRP